MFMVLFRPGSVREKGLSEKITDVGKAKHENIIKIIYFSAAIVVFLPS
jgi:hypothetical protein